MFSNKLFSWHSGFWIACMMIALLGTNSVMAQQKDIVYIEASTANRWKLGEFGARVKDERYRIVTMVQYDFDKTAQVEKALGERGRKPDLIVIQECSVYFPGDLAGYRASYQSWIRQVKQAGAKVAIATTVPPAKSQGFSEDAKRFIKESILGREGQLAQVVKFNDWLRQLAQDEKVPLLDIEAALRISESDRNMRPEFDDGDGIHINRAAYDMLDQKLLQFLSDALR